MLTSKRARTILETRGGALVLTHTSQGKLFSLDDGTPVGRKAGEELTQACLFPSDTVGLEPNEDGLFEGHSQTWSRT